MLLSSNNKGVYLAGVVLRTSLCLIQYNTYVDICVLLIWRCSINVRDDAVDVCMKGNTSLTDSGQMFL